MPSFHCDTERAAFKCHEIWQTGISEIVHCLPHKKNKISPGTPAVDTARIVPKICQDKPLTIYSECSTFHPNQLAFGGVMAERMNSAKK